MTHPDLFLWDLLKGVVRKHKLRTVDGLSGNITNTNCAFAPALLAATFVNMEHRFDLSLQTERNQLQHNL
jgi:hypothetical protein